MFLGVEEDKCLVETRTQGKKEGEENGITKAGTATKYQLVPNHFRIALLPGQLTCLVNIKYIYHFENWILNILYVEYFHCLATWAAAYLAGSL